ncbi:MAG TPA: N-formylglutamate deformylase [Xanthomonadaceae bacterium]|nr:N-formylglutamate deformylase [Xanthomonadaceae bacterium]
MSDTYTLHHGRLPLLISLPHDGTEVPDEVAGRFTPIAAMLPDTDWHIGRLYAFAREMGVSMLRPRFSRYVIDLNRPTDGTLLYPGRTESALCPLQTFEGLPIYRVGEEPGTDEIAERIERYWRPYHEALDGEISRLRHQHSRVVLWEAHSIKGVLPRLFEDQLPDFNIGTADGDSCTRALEDSLRKVLGAQRDYSYVVNGRFKGGHITRHYGRPGAGSEAVQLELRQGTYMDEVTFEYDEARARRVQAVIRELIEAALAHVE